MMEGPSSVKVVIGGDDHDRDHDFVTELPPGFRFHPTDEEIITHYLTEKVMNSSFSARAVGEVDLNKCEPWDLPKKAKMGEKEWYFFCQRDRKYPTGMRTNRATESGYWKATGKDKEIYMNKKGRGGGGGGGCLVGMKKTLVFYKGRAPKGEKSNWVMHEYRLEGQFSYYNFPKPAKDEWVVCRVFHKSTGIKLRSPSTSGGLPRMNSSSFVDDLLIMDSPNSQQLPPLMDHPPYTYSNNIDERVQDGDQGEIIKGKATASAILSAARSSSDNGDHYLSYFSADLNDKNHFEPHSNYSSSYQAYMMSTNPTTLDSIFYPQIQLPNLGYLQPSFHGSAPNMKKEAADDRQSILLRALAMKHGASTTEDQRLNYCKMEQQQFSSNGQSSVVSVSQDTGLSTDITTGETSSVISKKDMGSNTSNYEDLEDPTTSVGPLSDDLDYDIWNY